MNGSNPIADTFSTSPSIIKTRALMWLQTNPDQSPGTEDLARTVRASVGATNSALWSLRRGGYVAFHERKGSDEGHGSAISYAERIRLTDKGREWTAKNGEEAQVEGDYIESTLGQAPQEVAEVASEMIVESIDRVIIDVPRPPHGYRADDLAWWLKHQPDRKGRVRDFNEWYGLRPGNVMAYQAVERNPEAFSLERGVVSFIGPDDWRFTPKSNGRRTESEPEVIVSEKLADFAAGVAHTTVLPDLGPQLQELRSRAAKRAKVAEAVALLEAAGLEEDALSALSRIPDDSPLEAEVLALLSALGY